MGKVGVARWGWRSLNVCISASLPPPPPLPTWGIFFLRYCLGEGGGLLAGRRKERERVQRKDVTGLSERATAIRFLSGSMEGSSEGGLLNRASVRDSDRCALGFRVGPTGVGGELGAGSCRGGGVWW